MENTQSSTILQTPSTIYTLQQAADVLGMHERTLLDRLRTGEIKASKQAGRWYILHSSLVEWVESGYKQVKKKSNQTL